MKPLNAPRSYPSPSDVIGRDLLTAVAVGLGSEVADRAAADTVLQGQIDTLADNVWTVTSGDAVFTPAGATVVPCAIVKDVPDDCIITIVRTGPGTLADAGWSLGAIVNGTSFEAVTPGATDDGPFRWWVARKAGT